MSTSDLTEIKDRWVCWTWQQRDNKMAKVPMTTERRTASSTNPATWLASLSAATKAKNLYGYCGVGIVLGTHSDETLVGVDLDHALDNQIASRGAKIALAKLPATYTEISPSGSGLHALWWVTGDVSKLRSVPRAKVEGQAVELYVTGRYFTVTRNCVRGRTSIATVTADQLQQFTDWLSPPPPVRESREYTEPTAEDQQIALAILSELDPDLDEPTWFAVGAVLETIFADEGATWESWSCKGAKHKTGDCRQSISRYEGSYNLGTLIKIAREQEINVEPIIYRVRASARANEQEESIARIRRIFKKGHQQ